MVIPPIHPDDEGGCINNDTVWTTALSKGKLKDDKSDKESLRAMSIQKCYECGRDVSTLATACPHCGAPVRSDTSTSTPSYDPNANLFSGTLKQLVQLAIKAVQQIGWKIDQVNESAGIVTFQTGISWGSWSGVSCSLFIEEIGPGQFRVQGTGKQNVSGLQLVAINIGGEAQKRAGRAVEVMKQLTHRSA